MTTTTFKNIRALIQLFSVLLIIINIPLPILLFINSSMVSIESDHLQMGFLSLTFMYKIIIICNITLGMFASCGTNSKVKLYMRIYLLSTFTYLMVFLASILYINNRYIYQLNLRFTEKTNNNMTTRFILESLLQCNTVEDSCKNELMKISAPLIRYFLWISCTSFALHLLSFIFIKIAVNISIENPAKKLPKFVNITRAGMDTQSLRQKKIIEVETDVSNQNIVI